MLDVKRRLANWKTMLKHMTAVAIATSTTIAPAALLCTCLGSRKRVIPRKTKTVAWMRSATTPTRTSPEFATTFAAVVATRPFARTKRWANSPKMATNR